MRWIHMIALAGQLASTGCLKRYEWPLDVPPPRAQEAAQLTWTELGRGAEPLPRIVYRGERCSATRFGLFLGADCKSGLYFPKDDHIELLPYPLPSDTVLVHELTHADLWRKHGDADNGHSKWPDAWARLEPINQKLKDKGM